MKGWLRGQSNKSQDYWDNTFTIDCSNLHNEHEKLRKIEWLYHSERILYNTDKEQKILLIKEKDFLKGAWKELYNIKYRLRHFETQHQLDKTHLYVYQTEE